MVLKSKLGVFLTCSLRAHILNIRVLCYANLSCNIGVGYCPSSPFDKLNQAQGIDSNSKLHALDIGGSVLVHIVEEENCELIHNFHCQIPYIFSCN